MSEFPTNYRCTNCQSVYADKQEALECCMIQEVHVCACGRSYALLDLAWNCLAGHAVAPADFTDMYPGGRHELSNKSFLPPEADHVPNLIGRYQACALRIWNLFPSDPLPIGDPAQFWIERLEAVLDRDLLTTKENQ